MLQTRSNRPRSAAFHLKTALVIIFLACAAAIVGLHFSSSLQGTDFPDFYCAARIVLNGHGKHLYETALQYRFQTEYAGRVGTLYIHPPFETVFYVAVAWLPLRYAYVLWSFLNLLFLAIAARALAQATLRVWNWRILCVCSLTFVPLLLSLIQGQDSILLLLLLVLAYAALYRGHDFLAGSWLALGLFKFQLVLPIALVLLLSLGRTRRRALTSSFILVALALMGLSAAISGWSALGTYPEFLMHLTAQRFAGIIPQAMPNFRGLLYALFHDHQSPSAIAVMLILSAATMIGALLSWKQVPVKPPLTTNQRSRFDLAFSNTVLFSLLVSYHLNPHDLTLLLLPIALTLHHILANRKTSLNEKQPSVSGWTAVDWTTLAVLAILFLPPLHVLALKSHLYALISIPLIMLFVSISLILQKGRTHEAALHIDNG